MTYCCNAFEKAHEKGTDNEAYSPLVYKRDWLDEDGPDGCIAIGCDLPAIKFCPWCGAKVQQ